MSKLETPMTRRYWRQVGGTLIEEFPAVRRREDRGQRLIDGIILPEGEPKIVHWKDASLEGKVLLLYKQYGEDWECISWVKHSSLLS